MDLKYCPKCGNPLKPVDMKFCPNCKTLIETEPIYRSNTGIKAKKKVWRNSSSLLLLLGSIIGIIGSWYRYILAGKFRTLCLFNFVINFCDFREYSSGYRYYKDYDEKGLRLHTSRCSSSNVSRFYPFLPNFL